MEHRSVINIQAGLLQEAVFASVPKPRKNSRKIKAWPLSLRLDIDAGNLEVFESNHALKGYTVPATGQWPDEVQVDGHMLRRIVDKFDGNEEISLTATGQELLIQEGKSQISVKRLDDGPGKGVELRPIPQNPRHAGLPVEPPPDLTGRRYSESDTWDFSARVPIPEHRNPKE